MSASAHDYGRLLHCWRKVAQATGLHLRTLCESGGQPVIVIENPIAASGETGGLYLSAGVHGDECAPVWALLEWAESSPEILRTRPVVLFPCLNPVGLMENTRRDGSGIDLNRRFEDTSHSVIGTWQAFLSGRRFDTAINLHEDYDASGIYLYELTRGESSGEALLAACEHLIPREPAETVDGSSFAKGLLVHTGNVEQVVEEQLGGGYPEAIYLFLHHTATSYTFETPSELDLARRIATHRAFLEAVAG